MEQRFSAAAGCLKGQPMFQILSRIKEMERLGNEVVHFEIGDPDFDTPPAIVDALKKALDDGWTHYSASVGDYDLRQEICDSRFFTPSFTPSIDQVAIAPGANPFIYYAVRCLAEAGDDIIIPDPSFSTYDSVLAFCGVNAIRVPLKEENGFQMMAKDVEKAITARTRLVIVNNPNNPTGAVTSREELEKIAQMCLDRGIYLYSDEIYSYLNYTGKALYSPAELDHCKERVIVATGFSKTFAMTGWRLGVGIAPAELIEKIALMIETTVSCAATFVQRAGLEALRKGMPDVIRMRNTYKARRDYLVDRLNSMGGIECEMPEGAFYVFPNIKKLGISDTEFSEKLLLEACVGTCPGSYFGKYGEGYVRLCYATSKENIEKGMNRMECFVKKLRK